MSDWFIYILCCSDDTLYTGITTDVTRRLAQHNNKVGAKYTKHRVPCTLVYCEQAQNRSIASMREAEIKKMSRQEKMVLIKEK